MTYEDAEGQHREEPACASCIRRFSWTASQKAVIEKVLRYHYMMEEYETEVWNTLTSLYSNSDYWATSQINALLSALESSMGPFELDFHQIRAFRGSIHLALASGVLTCEQATAALDVCRMLESFGHHLGNHGRDQGDLRIDRDILVTLGEPAYVGCWTLEKAWHLAPRLAGKSNEEIADVLGKEVDGLLDELKANLAKSHGGRRGRSASLEVGVRNAIEVIENNAEQWLRLAKEASECVELVNVSDDVHGQVFLIDELFALDGTDLEPSHRTLGGRSFYRAIDKIRSLVDWDECENVKRWMDAADKYHEQQDAACHR